MRHRASSARDPAVPRRRTQTERTTAMRQRLVDAAIASLIESGYARTTAVDICRRAGVTRGAFHHHFASLAELLAAALERVYTDAVGNAAAPPSSLADLVRRGFERTRRPAFKAVIEIWLASRNDPELGRELAPAIARLSRLFAPDDNPRLGRIVSRKNEALYRLAVEAMIGLALGRAVSADGSPVAHEPAVMKLLESLVRDA